MSIPCPPGVGPQWIDIMYIFNEAPDEPGDAPARSSCRSSHSSPKLQVKDMWPSNIMCVVKELTYANAAVL